MATITLTLNEAEQAAAVSVTSDEDALNLASWIEPKVLQAQGEQVDHCSGCNQPVRVAGGMICFHVADTPGQLPGMPCPCTGTELYIAADCTCGRVIDECRCSG